MSSQRHKKTPDQELNFLLIMPRLVQKVGDGYVFPLGLAYISSSLKKAGFKTFTLNLNHRQGNIDDIIASAIAKDDIDVVATGGLSPQYHLVKSVVDAAKKAKPAVKIVVGGGIISSDPEVAMTALARVDYGVIGEGEVTMCKLAGALEQGASLENVDGIILKDQDGYKITKPRAQIENIDTIPWPDYEGFNIEEYLNVPPAGFAGLSQSRMICMQASRSCPFNCTFCFHSTGRKYRRRSLDDFFSELDYLVKKYDIKYISLADELFAPTLSHAKAFCERIKQYNITWYADFRIDKVKPELLEVLKDSGLNVMFFGIESADNRILESMRKGITIEEIERVLKMVTEYGIAVYGCFIFGDVAETVETAQNTLKWWREHSEYNIHLTLVKPFPGSEIYKYACKKGIIKDPIQYLKEGCPQVNISQLNNKEFAYVVEQISQAQYLSAKIQSLKLIKLDPEMGRETISGICIKCHKENKWENIKLFALDYIYCHDCGQKYDIPCPPEVKENLNRNISLLLDQYGKIGIWGMTLGIMDLFKDLKIFQHPRIYPVDIASSKQQMNLYGKRIYDPVILDQEDIRAVVIAVPSHAGQISCQIKENHPQVSNVFDICRLIDFDPILIEHK